MRRPKKNNGFGILKNFVVSSLVASVDKSLSSVSLERGQKMRTFFTTNPPILCATKIVGVLNQLNVFRGMHIVVLVIVQIKPIKELLSKIRNIEHAPR